MRALNQFFVLVLMPILSIIGLSGCVQVAPIPNTAHAGDTITLGLGGINRNWNGQAPKNLHVVLTDAAAQSYVLQPQLTFQAYPDYRSGVNVKALQNGSGMKLEPYDGGWFLTVALTDAAFQPLNLAVGSASISVTADNLITAVDDQGKKFAYEGDLAKIPVEIIAGPPSSSDPNSQFSFYGNRGTHFLIRPSSTAATVIGGAYYVINYRSGGNFGTQPLVFPVAHNPFVKMDYKLQQNGDGSGSYYVYIYDPSGFTAATPRQSKQAALRDLGVHFEYFDNSLDTWMKANVTLDAVNSYYIDLNGNKITGLHAEMLHSTDL
jgi:hypothetical protein